MTLSHEGDGLRSDLLNRLADGGDVGERRFRPARATAELHCLAITWQLFGCST